MELKVFKELSEEEKVALVNKRLDELRQEGATTSSFKSEKLNFTYGSATNEMTKLGYARNGKHFEKKVSLSEEEVIILKNLAYNYEFLMRERLEHPEVRLRKDDNVSTTSVRMYNQVWKRWQEFSKEWGIYNSVDLMATALEEYMDKHEFTDYQTLVAEGKIKEDKKKSLLDEAPVKATN